MAAHLRGLVVPNLTFLFSLFLLLLLFELYTVDGAPIIGIVNEGATPQVSSPDNTESPSKSNTSPTAGLASFEREHNGAAPTDKAAVAVNIENVLPFTEPSLTTFTDVNFQSRNSDGKLDRSRSVSEGFLWYEIRRDIIGLSLDAIDYVLELGPEVFVYSLADKLGYLANGEDDPHIAVIETNKEQLLGKLRSQATRMKEEMNVEADNPTQKESIVTTSLVSQSSRVELQDLLRAESDTNERTKLGSIQSQFGVSELWQESSDVPGETKGLLEASSTGDIVTTTTTRQPEPTATLIPQRNEENPGTAPTNENFHTVALPSNDNEKSSDISDSVSAKLFEKMLSDAKFLETLIVEDKVLYHKLNEAELNQDAATKLLTRYRVWLRDQHDMDGYHKGGGDVELATAEAGIGKVKSDARQEAEEEANDGEEKVVVMEDKHDDGDGRRNERVEGS